MDAQPTKPRQSALRLFARLHAEQKQDTWLAVALVVILGLVNGLGVVLLVPLMNVAGLGNSTESIPATMVNHVLSFAGIDPTLAVMIGLFLAITLSQAALLCWQSQLHVRVQQRLTESLRNRLFHTIGRANWSMLLSLRRSDLIHVMTMEIDRISVGSIHAMRLASHTILITVYVAAACAMSPLVTAVAVVCAATTWPLVAGFNRRSKRSGYDFTATSRLFHQAIEEHLAGLKEVRCLGLQHEHGRQFQSLTAALTHSRLRFQLALTHADFATRATSFISLAVIAYLSLTVFRQDVSHLVVSVYVFARVFPLVGQIHQSRQHVSHMLPAQGNYHEFLDSLSQSSDARGIGDVSGMGLCGATPRSRSSPRMAPPSVSVKHEHGYDPLRQVSCDGVWFRYDRSSENWLFKDLSIEFPAGATSAIVGASGVGKSTLVDLLTGLLQPERGDVRIDGDALEPAFADTWQTRIGYVTQDTFLFRDTVRANLMCARPNASPEAIQHAIRLAAAEFLWDLPDGLNTEIGDRGTRLSGGERQRLALARAVLRNPSLLILDEATSGLDPRTQHRIHQRLEQWQHAMTVIRIAHRPSVLVGVQHIFVLDGGRVVQSGSYEQLVQDRSGHFVLLMQAELAAVEVNQSSRAA
ncbi:MAG: ABC transporter ATP-binding protein [Planctomycetota bacterium]|nr:ABC transporter ATP-binding protein [Planctomycetota bacterium]